MFPFGYSAKDSWPNGIDLIAFFRRYAAVASSRAGKSDALEIVSAASAAILYTANSPDPAGSPSGIAFYFPETADVLRKDPEGVGYSPGAIPPPSRFVRSSRWPRVLKNFLIADETNAVEKPASSQALTDVIQVGESARQPKAEVCIDGGIDEEAADARASETVDMVVNRYDTLDVNVAVFSLVDDFCQSGSISGSSFKEWLKVANGANDPAIFVHATILLVCRNEDNTPSHPEFMQKLLAAVKTADPTLYKRVMLFFEKHTLLEASHGQFGEYADLLPTYGDTALFFAIHNELFDWNDQRDSSRWIASRLFVAQAYLNLVLPDLKKALNARLEFGPGVKDVIRGALPNAVTVVHQQCDALSEWASKADAPFRALPKAMIEECWFDQLFLAYLMDTPAVVVPSFELRLRDLPGDTSDQERERRVWQLHWFYAQALFESNRTREAISHFKQAYQALLFARLPAVHRFDELRAYQGFVPTANVFGDEGEPEDSAYLFFCQWIAASSTIESPVEQLKIIERSRLFGGDASIVTGLFGGESDILGPNVPNRKLTGQDRLRQIRTARSDAIETATFESTHDGTVVYFENAWNNHVMIYLWIDHNWMFTSSYYSMIDGIRRAKSNTMLDLTGVYGTYVSPIWYKLKYMKDGTRIYIIPDGFSRSIPFSALETPDGTLVIDHFIALFNPSLVNLKSGSDRIVVPAKMLMIHDTEQTKDKFFSTRLFNVEQESKFVRQISTSSHIDELRV